MAESISRERYNSPSRLGPSIALTFALTAISGLGSTGEPPGSQKRPDLDPRLDVVITEFRETVPGLMKRHKVPGAAFALVDEQGIVWTEGFGFTTPRGKTPVTPDTPFFLGGMSKLVTATAVMCAVQHGTLDLERPVTNYLPDFKVLSRYEENPESRITLRRLLNNTAGLPVEAPLGNYFEPCPMASFQDHARSIYGSWLVFPASQAFQAGNTGFDLAAYILQVTTGKPFEKYLEEEVLKPLGMSETTADRDRVLNTKHKATGHMTGIDRMPEVLPCLGAAGLYSTARDVARFVQFHMGQGTVEGKRLLDSSLLRVLQTPAGIVEAPYSYFGMGVYIDKRAPERVDHLLWADGWGFGFCGLIHWYPEYGIGVVALSNRLPNPGLNELAFSLTDRLIREKTALRRFPFQAPSTNNCVGTWSGDSGHTPTPYRAEWKKYTGAYALRFSGYELEWWAKVAVFIKGRDEYTPRIHVHRKDGYLCLTESKFFDVLGLGRHVDERLQELKPGVFSAASGIVLNLAADEPTWRSYRLEKR